MPMQTASDDVAGDLAFEQALMEMFQRIPGIIVGPTQPKHGQAYDLSLAEGSPIGIPGLVFVEAKFRPLSPNRRSIKNTHVDDKLFASVAARAKADNNPLSRWLLITNGILTKEARRHASDKLILWDALDIRLLLEKFPQAAQAIQHFLPYESGNAPSAAWYRPTVSVVRHDKGWTLTADAFVLPLGIMGALSGSTFRALLSEQIDPIQFEKIIKNAVNTGLTPEEPKVLRQDVGRVKYLILATAFAPNGKILPGQALAAIVSIEYSFQRIVLPLLGASNMGSEAVLDQFHTAIIGSQRAAPLHIIIVVIDDKTETLARQRLRDLEAPGDTVALAPATLPHFINDAIGDDKPCQDRLGLEAEARTFARLLACQGTTLPLAIGLFGNWGSGKSFFMRLVRQQMKDIAKAERAVARPSQQPVYCTAVAHITFNAWHYLDGNLWASLALRIFEGVAAHLSDPTSENPSYKKAAEQRRILARKIESSERAIIEAQKSIVAAEEERQACGQVIAELRRERAKETCKLSLADLSALKPEVAGAIETLGLKGNEKIADFEQSLGKVWGLSKALAELVPDRAKGWPAWKRSLLALGVGLCGGWLLLDWLPAHFGNFWETLLLWAASGTAMARWAANRLEPTLNAVKTLNGVVARVRKAGAGDVEDEAAKAANATLLEINLKIDTQRHVAAAAERELAEAADRLQKVKSGALVYEFLTERALDRQYAEGTGIVSVLRQDLEKLREKLEEMNGNAANERSRLERIVLYIDDLDRCDPDRVVNVLQAVHLLLAFDLFAVIVAVDARWLERSLYMRYLPGFDDLKEEQLAAGDFSPQNYLEKIFQIPFHVPSMGATGFGSLIDALAPKETTVTAGATAQARPQDVPAPGAEDAGPANAPADSTGEPEATRRPADVSLQRAEPPLSPLTFNDHEIATMKAAGAHFITTPRGAKRLVNAYALIRMQVSGADLDNLRSQTSPSASALVMLLAVDIGLPFAAQAMREAMRQLKQPSSTLPDMIDALIAECCDRKNELGAQLDQLRKRMPVIELVPDVMEFRRWLRYVDRLSFHKPEAPRSMVKAKA
jgi:dephospho-CoA kinase